MRRALIAAALAATAVASAAQAAPYARPPKGQDGPNLTHASAGWLYYNRPGATLAQHNADLADCVALSESKAPFTGVIPPQINYGYQPSVAPALLAGAADAEIAEGFRQSRMQLCMVAHGWRVVDIGEDAAVKLKKLKGEEFNAAFEPLVGAETPRGRIVAAFANQAARGDSVKFATPRPADQTVISLRALDHASRPGPLPEPVRSPAELDVRTGAARAVPAADRTSTLVLRLTGDRKFHGGDTLVLADEEGREISLTLPQKGPTPDAQVVATYPVRPGRYHIAAIRSAMPSLLSGMAARGPQTLDFCMGAPFFDVASGQVLYLGAFDLKGELGPDMDLAPARAALSDPAAASALAPAAWINGATSACGGTWSFALVIPGAPYADGYAGPRLP